MQLMQTRQNYARGAAPRSLQSASYSWHARRQVTTQALKALIFDCEGTILDREDLRRRAYNASFKTFNVQQDGENVLEWIPAEFSQLQVSSASREPEMKGYFRRSGWPTSSLLEGRAPATEEECTQLIAALQQHSEDVCQNMISSGDVGPRPGVLRLMDEARTAGLTVSVCSAAAAPAAAVAADASTSGSSSSSSSSKSTTASMLGMLLGRERLDALDCLVTSEDLAAESGASNMYKVAASKLGVEPSECLVVEDSQKGLQDAMAAGMRCVITYTNNTKWQEFPGAERIVSDLESGEVTVRELLQHRIVQDDRINMTVTDSGVFWSKAGGF